MTRKKVNIKPRSELKGVEEKIDEWVLTSNNHESHSLNVNNIKSTEKLEDIFRFTFHMPSSLHKKIKRYCVDNDISMKDKIIEILEREFDLSRQ
jgi:hypothetical protein